jgi:hypothetical protein
MRRSRTKTAFIGVVALAVIVIATALAVGGSGSTPHLPSGQMVRQGVPALKSPAHGIATGSGTVTAGVPTVAAPRSATAGGTGPSGSVGAPSLAEDASLGNATSAVTATRIVKTGNLNLRVTKGAVQATMGKLSQLASSKGGYVAHSTTDANSQSPSGQIELRVPVAQFASTVAAAQALGHVESLTTSANDVTGKYVDLRARKHALESTRSTYLTILSRATTIGATLSVQQRIDDVQQQIDELHGELKLLASQSSFSTLDVNVDQPSIVPATKTHHDRHGLSKAWHTSISRFNRGIDAIVSALGPLLLAGLLIGAAVLIARIGLKGARRHRSSDAAS